jgi:hypothetical protein
LVLVACGGGEETPTARSTAPAGGAGDTDVPNVIWMTATAAGEEDIEAVCVGVATKYRLKGQRRQRVVWKIENDPNYPCPDLNVAQVQVRFSDSMPLAENASPMAPPLDRMNGDNSGFIRAFIHADSMYAPDDVHDYLIYYQDARASRDPELDIQGDCAGCGL